MLRRHASKPRRDLESLHGVAGQMAPDEGVTDKLLGVLPFGLEWLKAAGGMALIDPTKGRDINLRIYADYEALRAYQMMSIRNVRESLYT